MTSHWVGSLALISVLLVLDLWVFRRKARTMKMREAFFYTCLWISVALLFNGYIYYSIGTKPAVDFFTGYLIEYSLSVDNLFVFMLIFSHFRVPQEYQQRVLFFGIVGAILMRGLFIWLGATLLEVFHWTFYVFGALLIGSGIKLFFQKENEIEPEDYFIYQKVKKLLPLSPRYDGQKFVTRIDGKLFATPLFLVLVSVEVSDLIFAVDSIPAIFGITRDPFIVFTSNIFAVLGLRSLYFLLATSIHKIDLLQYGLALILIFVGLKMVLESTYPIPNGISLLVICLILGGSLAASILLRRHRARSEK